MPTRLAPLLAAAALAAGCGQAAPPLPPPPPPPPTEDMKALAAGNTDFAVDLYKRVAATTDGNIVLSPYSVSSALAMTYAGARGETAAGMRKALHFDLPDDRLHAAMAGTGDRLAALARPDAVTLDAANALWPAEGLKLAEPFLDLTRKHYQAGVNPVDFARPDAARKRINGWVGDKTRGKIPELLKAGDITPATRLVLTNAVYLNAAWATPFPRADTRDGAFAPSAGETLQVPMMRLQNRQFGISGTADFRLLQLPYRGGDLAMCVVLPVKRWGLREVEEKLTGRAVRDMVAAMRTQLQREVVLPRFAARSPVKLAPPLSDMGMGLAFSPGADFTGLAPTGGLSIAEVIHEGAVEVDERGTVAVAATAVATVASSPGEFRVDQPFLFLIVDRAAGTVLFLGRVVRP